MEGINDRRKGPVAVIRDVIGLLEGLDEVEFEVLIDILRNRLVGGDSG